GGFIFVTKGLLRCCKDEDALAGVLAHEIGHVEKMHGLQAIKQSRITDALTTIGMEGAKQFGPQELNLLTETFSETIQDITNTLIVSGYSRSQESEADMAAATLLSRVGYNPQGLMHMLEQMEGRIKPDALDFAKTHPSPEDRIASLEPTLGPYTPYTLPQPRIERFVKQIAWV
ncbi:MAG: M48 family metallopeptidase, partial [Desulfobacterales bacterium]|nr:M48 family metallopeptidase [Desulfobacterales bacterium]